MSRLTDDTTSAWTLPLWRSLTPTTAVLPTPPVPAWSFLALVLVLLQAAHVDLVHFDFAAEPALGLERFADAVRHEPSGFLVDAEFAVQTHGTDALEADGVQVDGVCPIAQGDLGSVHGRPGPDGEIFAAVPAAVGHWLARLALDGVERSAMRAEPAFVPDDGFEPLFRRPVVGEHLEDFAGGQPFAFVPSRCFLSHFDPS